jgi:hypothetical protein
MQWGSGSFDDLFRDLYSRDTLQARQLEHGVEQNALDDRA